MYTKQTLGRAHFIYFSVSIARLSYSRWISAIVCILAFEYWTSLELIARNGAALMCALCTHFSYSYKAYIHATVKHWTKNTHRYKLQYADSRLRDSAIKCMCYTRVQESIRTTIFPIHARRNWKQMLYRNDWCYNQDVSPFSLLHNRTGAYANANWTERPTI